MTPNVSNLTPVDCLALVIRLRRYGSTNVRLLHTLLLILSILTAINFSLSVMSCFLPARNVPCTTLVMLIIGPIAILVPYFVFDSRLDRLSLNAVTLPSSVQKFFPDIEPKPVTYKGHLFKAIDHCNLTLSNWTDIPPKLKEQKISLQFPRKRSSEKKYYFGDTEDRWEVAIIVCTVGSAIVGLRSLFAGLRDHVNLMDEELDDNAMERGFTYRVDAFRRFDLDSMEDRMREAQLIERVLETLRVDENMAINFRPKQCAICLEDMREDVLTKLSCEHTYHENCIRTWLQTAYRRECPMCKATIGEGSDHHAHAHAHAEEVEIETRAATEDGTAETEETEFNGADMGTTGTDAATAGTEASDGTTEVREGGITRINGEPPGN